MYGVKRGCEETGRRRGSDVHWQGGGVAFPPLVVLSRHLAARGGRNPSAAVRAERGAQRRRPRVSGRALRGWMGGVCCTAKEGRHGRKGKNGRKCLEWERRRCQYADLPSLAVPEKEHESN